MHLAHGQARHTRVTLAADERFLHAALSAERESSSPSACLVIHEACACYTHEA